MLRAESCRTRGRSLLRLSPGRDDVDRERRRRRGGRAARTTAAASGRWDAGATDGRGRRGPAEPRRPLADAPDPRDPGRQAMRRCAPRTIGARRRRRHVPGDGPSSSALGRHRPPRRRYGPARRRAGSSRLASRPLGVPTPDRSPRTDRSAAAPAARTSAGGLGSCRSASAPGARTRAAIARPSSAVAIRPWPVAWRRSTRGRRRAGSSSAVSAVARECRDADRDADRVARLGPRRAGRADRLDRRPRIALGDPERGRRRRCPAGSGRTRRRRSGRRGRCRGRRPRSPARSRRSRSVAGLVAEARR